MYQCDDTDDENFNFCPLAGIWTGWPNMWPSERMTFLKTSSRTLRRYMYKCTAQLPWARCGKKGASLLAVHIPNMLVVISSLFLRKSLSYWNFLYYFYFPPPFPPHAPTHIHSLQLPKASDTSAVSGAGFMRLMKSVGESISKMGSKKSDSDAVSQIHVHVCKIIWLYPWVTFKWVLHVGDKH